MPGRREGKGGAACRRRRRRRRPRCLPCGALGAVHAVHVLCRPSACSGPRLPLALPARLPAPAGGLASEALAVLEGADGKGAVKDRLGLLEARGRLFLALGRWEEAEGVYR